MAHDNRLTPAQHMLSACSGAILTSLLVTPLDVTKTRLQSAFSCTTCFGELSLPNMIVFCSCNPTRAGTMDTMLHIARNEGVRTLWRGLSPTMAMQVPATVVYFVGYDHLRHSLSRSVRREYAPMVAGAMARTTAVTIISPMELLRTRLQATSAIGQDFNHVLQGIATMVRQRGARFLWRGLSPTLWRDVPFSAIYWTIYERCNTIKPKHDYADTMYMAFFSGAAAGMVAAISTTPFDVVKTRRQVDGHTKQRSVLASLARIAQSEGVPGLFRGVTPRVAKVVPACAIMMSSYEVGKRVFARSNSTINRRVPEGID